MADPAVSSALSRLAEIREKAGLSQKELDAKLIFGPGWVQRFESGAAIPALDVLFVMLSALDSDLADLAAGIGPGDSQGAALVDRNLWAEEDGAGLTIHFRYADHDARYRLEKATLAQFEEIIRVLRDGLALIDGDGSEERAVKTDAVARCFLKAVETWPDANPSDLWWFLVSRAYNDPFNHPARFARLDLGQSWKRTGGWALEEILVRHYGPAFEKDGIRLFVATTEERRHYLSQLAVADRLEVDKMDVLLAGIDSGEERCFGVVHVKASFAERRTDDVPMSHALVEAGYCSPLWTMDCKSTPSVNPVNCGELGVTLEGSTDKRSAKRKDIEDDGYFSACFSYNNRTRETPADQSGARGRIQVCDFNSPSDDQFAHFIRQSWKQFRESR